MKKIFLLLSVVGLFSFSSCSDDDTIVNNYFEAEVFEINNANFGPEGGVYTSWYYLDPAIFPADMILVYRLAGVDAGRDVWELIPRTVFTDFGPVDFDFNFTTNDIQLVMASDVNLGSVPNFTQNQVFRVVIIPGFDNSAVALNKNSANYDYNYIVKKYNIDESNIRELRKK
jgi:hypothetical protein